jgi:hypothetical protein
MNETNPTEGELVRANDLDDDGLSDVSRNPSNALYARGKRDIRPLLRR